MVSPDISLEEPPRTSTPVQAVITSTVRTYDLVEAATQTESPDSDNLSARIDAVIAMHFDVGGKLFTTSRATIGRHPEALLHRVLQLAAPCHQAEDGVPTYFIDRDPKHFPLILHYLRDGPKSVTCHLPRDPLELKKIHAEATFYGLGKLALVVGSQMYVSFLGHDSYQEE
jgi:hypothetical protein